MRFGVFRERERERVKKRNSLTLGKHRNKSKNTLFKLPRIIGGSLIVVLAAIGFISIAIGNTPKLNSDLSYTPSQSSDFNVALAVGAGVNASIAMTNTDSETEGDSTSCDLTPTYLTYNGTIITCKATVTVSTTSGYGYAVTLASSNTETRLVGTGDAVGSYIDANTGTYVTPSSLGNGKWGYALPNSQATINNVASSGFSSSYIVAEKDTSSNTTTNPNYDPDFVSAKYAPIVSSASPTMVRRTRVMANSDTFDIYFATRLNSSQSMGNYGGSVTIKIDANQPPIATSTWVKSVTALQGPSASSITIDKDVNMIPIVNQFSDGSSTAGNEWANYDDTKWANAVTLKNDIDKYATDGSTTAPTLTPLEYFRDYASVGSTIPEEDILGYWVYVPRYAYEVQRRDAVDIFVPANNFNIRFEKSTTDKKFPVATCSILGTGNAIVSASGATNKDYSGYATPANPNDDCNTTAAKTYPTSAPYNQSTWATHPAFTFGSTDLNGIWIAKFETTGSVTAPTVKPNLKSQTAQVIGVQYDIAASIGVLDPNKTGGNNTTVSQNSHSLNTFKSRMIKNSDWGAAAYLSASKYGAGVNNVQINSASTSMRDGNGTASASGITGCGPSNNGNTATYADADITGTTNYDQVATTCSKGNAQRNYYGTLGQLASTTNNVYGIYDMSGGAWDYVMSNRTTSGSQTTTSGTTYLATPITNSAYYDAYKTTAALGDTSQNRFGTQPTGSNTNEHLYNNDVCVFETCGGQALHETKTIQTVSENNQSWGSDGAIFVSSGSPWFDRGGSSNRGNDTGVFMSAGYTGNTTTDNLISFRASLSKF
ncbi:MAG: hypothetical protein LBM09_03230 [Candidatus Nomurabacteria bacterium]|jgi:hypothetical protein|nr:hypothetical protein [Candidatus Nomurabacteria bacterium]